MSHAQALLTRLANAIRALIYEVPTPPAKTFAHTIELLHSGHTALSRADADADASAQPDDPDPHDPDDQHSPLSHDRPDHASHPDLEAWLASRADTVTGEVDRRRVPIRNLLTASEFFELTAGKPMIAMTVKEDGVSTTDADTVSRGAELQSHIAEALYLVSAEATTWSPQARAQARALLRYAEDELAERCRR